MIKKNTLLFIATILIYSCTTEPKDPSEGLKSYYEISINEEFQIDLESNHTTGYEWEWANNQRIDIVESISQKYVADSNPLRLSGVGGTEVWKFKGVKSGVDSIIMKYRRPWEADTEMDSTVIKVKVR